MILLLRIDIKYEQDVVLARQRARHVSALLGLDAQDQIRIATAVSELARNAFQYAGAGKVEFQLIEEDRQQLRIRISDKGKGIDNLQAILDGSYVSRTGMGLGIIGAKRLTDDFRIESEKGKGTTVTIHKLLSGKSWHLPSITAAIASQNLQNPFAEIQRQNQELLLALDEVQKKRAELNQLNQELEETNRGVVALYAELEERADYLRRASDLKTQFLSNMTHEFRTPLNSILSISQILLERMDGELTSEQEKQVKFIKAGAQGLSDLVNDLLDLAKVEAGKVAVRPVAFEVQAMFGMLRGMLKPLLENNHDVMLVFDELMDIPTLETDEGKVSQILRNFISNGLKFTEKGEVRVSARCISDNWIIFTVKDTGIGIGKEDQQRVFMEFTQVESATQKKVKGTGLGLPLSKKLAELLGGFVSLESHPGEGSLFSVTLPMRYHGPEEVDFTSANFSEFQDALPTILVIDDDEADRYVIKRLFATTGIETREAQGGKEGVHLAREIKPAVILMDFMMPGMNGAEVLKLLKADAALAEIPVIIHTSQPITPTQQEIIAPGAYAVLSKNPQDKKILLATVTSILNNQRTQSDKARYA